MKPLAAKVLLISVAAMGLATTAAYADKIEYPAKVVTLTTQSSPGGGGDVFLRQISRVIGRYIDADFVVENVVGGGGTRAMAALAESPSDGSMLYATTPTFLITSVMSKPDIDYTDLAPVANMFFDPIVLYVKNDSPYKSLTEVVDAAKKSPGTIPVSVGEAASLDPVVIHQLEDKTGTKMIVITHDGGGDTMLDVLNGTGQMGIGEIGELAGEIKGGDIRVIASLSDERIHEFPNVPTAKEQGIDLVARKFRGFVGQKNMAPEAIAAWEKVVPELLEDSDLKAWYSQSALIPAFMEHEKYGEFLNDWAKQQREFYIKNGVIKE
jgi:tripartite-type tricarboxylate transporter receptor subunit TctC